MRNPTYLRYVDMYVDMYVPLVYEYDRQPVRQPVSVFHVELVASSRPILSRGHARPFFFFFLSSITVGVGPRLRLYPYTLPPRLY